MTINLSRNGWRPLILAVILCLSGTASGVARAEGLTSGDFSGSVTAASQYIFRGVSLSDNDPALQASVDYAASGFHAGLWGSTGTFNKGNVEVDGSAGYGGLVEGYTYDLSLVYYAYPGDSVDGNYVEAIGVLGRDFGRALVNVGVGYTPSGQQAYLGHDVYYLFSDIDIPIPDSRVTASFHVGYQDFGDTSRTHWTAGLFTIIAGLNVGLQYVDTNRQGLNLGARALLTVAKYF
jgi:uncharacterized protein (TIGR02001 family)